LKARVFSYINEVGNTLGGKAMRYFLSLMLVGLMSLAAAAQTTPDPPFTAWYARGEFGDADLDYNGINPPTTTLSRFDDLTYEMDFIGGNHWTVTVGSLDPFDPNDGHFLFPNFRYEFKIGDQDYNPSMPIANGAVWTNDIVVDPINDIHAGQIKFHMWDQLTWNDGWFPNDRRRVGYDDSGFIDWEIMSNANGFTSPIVGLTDMGNGLHRGEYVFATTGPHEFKFRRSNGGGNQWDTSIGGQPTPAGIGDFSNSGANSRVQTTTPNQKVTFELDLPNGRWRTIVDAPPLVGDHNLDGNVDAADYVMWRKTNPGVPLGYNQFTQHFGEGPGPLRWVIFSPQLGQKDLEFQSGTLYTAHYEGLAAGDYDFQAGLSDGSVLVPGGQVKVRANAAGEIDLNFNELIPLEWGDGFGPNNEHRLGYVDHDLFDWELIGSFNSWPETTPDPAYFLTDQGNGLHTGTFEFAQGSYDFKFRQQGTWNTSIGQNFANNANNNSFTVEGATEEWTFELDLTNGRFRAFEVVAGSGGAVPEPSTLVLAFMVGLATSGLIRRR
jgi:hypothetical protein